jgi:hypothetical protein
MLYSYERMSTRQRVVVYCVLGGVWLSGCGWLYLDQYCSRREAFGITPHPWEGPTLLLHGVIAIASMYVLGWLTARHITPWWRTRQRRLSGATLSAVLALLVLSGFALFFLSDDAWQRACAVAHDVLGLGVTVFAIQHWFFAGRHRRRRSRPS